MPFEPNRLEETSVALAEAEAAYIVLDEWLRLETEHSNPGFILPGRAAVIAWCENHALTIVALANVALWTPVILAMWQG